MLDALRGCRVEGTVSLLMRIMESFGEKGLCHSSVRLVSVGAALLVLAGRGKNEFIVKIGKILGEVLCADDLRGLRALD